MRCSPAEVGAGMRCEGPRPIGIVAETRAAGEGFRLLCPCPVRQESAPCPRDRGRGRADGSGIGVVVEGGAYLAGRSPDRPSRALAQGGVTGGAGGRGRPAAGAPSADAGASPAHAGASPADAGVSPADAGASPAERAHPHLLAHSRRSRAARLDAVPELLRLVQLAQELGPAPPAGRLLVRAPVLVPGPVRFARPGFPPPRPWFVQHVTTASSLAGLVRSRLLPGGPGAFRGHRPRPCSGFRSLVRPV